MTELIWDGKYRDGKRVGPVRISLPFQTVETVNESGAVRARQLDLFSQGQQTEWRNRLIWGDKKYVLPALLAEFAGKINLIYIDPPFATGADFSFTTTIPESDESFTKEPSIIEQKAYRDTWGRGLDSYLQWFYETVTLLHDLLAEDGSIYVHLDWHVSHYAKVVLDEVFGADHFQNEIAWHYSGWNKKLSSSFEQRHDTIMYYSKIDAPAFNSYFEPWSSREDYLKIRKQRVYLDESGREYTLDVRNGGTRQVRIYLEDALGRGKVVDSVWDIDKVNNSSKEAVDYATQKPEPLLERIITASSNPGDLVLDCFCGSGTTAAVAERLGRRWITCDLGRFAIHTARKRLLSNPNVKPFDVQNLGRYERQAWQAAEFDTGEMDTQDAQRAVMAQRNYRRFILDLYHAEPLEGYAWLHGLRDGRYVHVGAVDAPVALGDVQQIVREVLRARGPESSSNVVDVLGWEFAYDLNETASQNAAELNVLIKPKRIPREVLEKKAVEQGDIRFFELAALSLRVGQYAGEQTMGRDEAPFGKYATITLTDFLMPPDDIPEDVQQAVRHWQQWIDYWAVDWDYQGDAFHNMAQQYRTRKDPHLPTTLGHTYAEPGSYTVQVKVIDILGNDTTKQLTVEVR